MNESDKAYRDLVVEESRGTAPEGTTEMLSEDYMRWRNALQELQSDLRSQQAWRQAELAEFYRECKHNRTMNEYEKRIIEHRRWESNMIRFRAHIATRLSEVAHKAKLQKHEMFSQQRVNELTEYLCDLADAVQLLINVDDDDAADHALKHLERVYDALPESIRASRVRTLAQQHAAD
jgi:hypothetical protein